MKHDVRKKLHCCCRLQEAVISKISAIDEEIIFLEILFGIDLNSTRLRQN